jgi:hypothetical protein
MREPVLRDPGILGMLFQQTAIACVPFFLLGVVILFLIVEGRFHEPAFFELDGREVPFSRQEGIVRPQDLRVEKLPGIAHAFEIISAPVFRGKRGGCGRKEGEQWKQGAKHGPGKM